MLAWLNLDDSEYVKLTSQNLSSKNGGLAYNTNYKYRLHLVLGYQKDLSSLATEINPLFIWLIPLVSNVLALPKTQLCLPGERCPFF